MFPFLDRQAASSRRQPFTSLATYKRLGWLTGSTLLLLFGSSSQVAAQVVLFQETFANPQVTNLGSFDFGISGPSQPPCLTAATPIPSPPTAGTQQGIPPCSTNTTNANLLPDPAGSGTLRLTSSNNNQAAFVLFNRAIPSAEGLAITFDFFTYNGSGADGISFFLIDATQPPPQPPVAGAFGGSLGYAQRTDPIEIPGLPRGYVGIGFDEFGNYSNSNEGRVGGIGFTPDSVAIRGNAANNYQYLTGTTLPQGSDNPGATNRLAPGVRRTVRITLTPNNFISVDINFGAGFVNVIPPFNLTPVQGQAPPQLQFGFAGSTGDNTNIHEIQNLRITTVAPDLSLTKTGPANFTVGEQNSYSLIVQNSVAGGPTIGPITVTDTLPEGVNFISATGTNWTCTAVGSTVTCNYAGPRLETGAAAPPITLTVLPTATAGTSVRNTAKVATAGDDPDNPLPAPDNRTGDNITTINTPVVATPLLSATKTSQLNDANGNGLADPGEFITYTIAIENQGSAPSTNTVFTDPVPTNTTYVPNSSTLNGTTLADEAETSPFVDGEPVSSPSQPPASGTVNPGAAEAAVVQFQVKINDPLPPGVTQIQNQGTVRSDQVQDPPILTNPPQNVDNPGPTVTPIGGGDGEPDGGDGEPDGGDGEPDGGDGEPDGGDGEPRLRLVKRITQVNTTTYTNVVDDPTDANDNPGIWPATLQPLGFAQLTEQTPVKSGDEVEYTIYFLSDGTQDVKEVKLCDAIPAGTTFINNSFGTGSGILLNQGGTPIPQTNASDTDKGSFFSALTPVTAPCSNTNNPTGAILLNLGDIPANSAGFARFRVKID